MDEGYGYYWSFYYLCIIWSEVRRFLIKSLIMLINGGKSFMKVILHVNMISLSIVFLKVMVGLVGVEVRINVIFIIYCLFEVIN
jgi:hypothetical protein